MLAYLAFGPTLTGFLPTNLQDTHTGVLWLKLISGFENGMNMGYAHVRPQTFLGNFCCGT